MKRCHWIALSVVAGLGWVAGPAHAVLPHLTGHCDGPAKIECPPPFVWYAEGPPWLKYKKACPRPVCDPCQLEHYGYYQTCWQPWAFPPDWNHCPVPPASVMLPPPAYPPFTPRTPRDPYEFQRRQQLQQPQQRRPEKKESDPDLPSPRRAEEDRPAVRIIQ